MPRNASGTYTLPTGNPVVSGDIISSTWANDTMGDIASALTASLARDGSGGMTAALRVVDGSASIPGLAFGNETGSGLYRSAAGDVGLAILGNQILRMRSTGLDVTGALSYTGTLTGGTGVINIGSGQIYKDASGNVGIGTSSPGGKLTVQGDARFTDGTVDFRIQTETSFGAQFVTGNSYPILFATNGSERMRIDSSGNVGIGVTPSAWVASANSVVLQSKNVSFSALGTNDLHLSSNAYYDGSVWKYISSSVPATNYYQSAGTHVWRRAAAGTAGNTITWTASAVIDSSGNLSIGTSNAEGRKLKVEGTFYSTSTVQAPAIGNGTGTAVIIDPSGFLRANSSSRRYKENIMPIDVGLDLVMQMQPVKYDLKDGGTPQVGFIAEDFPEPRLVNHSLVDPDDPKKGERVESVNYGNLTAILVKAIQELKAEVDALKAAAV